MKKETRNLVIGIAVGAFVMSIIFYISSQPFIESNLEDTYEELKMIYATANDLEIKLEHRSFAKTYGVDESELCSNDKDSFDMWVEISFGDFIDKCNKESVECPNYECVSELIVGERTDLFNNAVWDLRQSSGYYTEGWIVSQKLKQEQQIRICCEPYYEQEDAFCKTARLEPYC